ncbi:MAG: IS3 family transposase [Gammaproteobacteria bacterium]|nr:MAG: IS3 family transposase [Gammaproteobacteria bacterium]
MTRSARRYTKEFKQEAINLALKSPSVESTAKELGIPAATLHSWIHTLKKKGNIATVDASGSKDMAALVEENRRLHKELAIAREEREILKKGGSVLCSTPEVKYVFIKANEPNFSVKRMCHMLSLERSGYYAWLKRKPGKRALSNEELDKKIMIIFKRHKSRYGAKRIADELHDEGETCSKNRIARRMKYLGLYAKAKKKFKVTTDSKHNLPVAPNLLNRDFTAHAPNQKWCGDISYVWTDEGWMYLAVVIDLYSRAVIGWSIQPTMSRQLVCDALMMAIWRRKFPRGVLFHSDRGSQYCSNDYQKILKSFGFICSMSRKGNCWDNSVAESFFHSLKTELVYTERYPTREIAKQSIFQYIEVYYNRVRRHSAIGSIAPEAFENQCKDVA